MMVKGFRVSFRVIKYSKIEKKCSVSAFGLFPRGNPEKTPSETVIDRYQSTHS